VSFSTRGVGLRPSYETLSRPLGPPSKDRTSAMENTLNVQSVQGTDCGCTIQTLSLPAPDIYLLRPSLNLNTIAHPSKQTLNQPTLYQHTYHHSRLQAPKPHKTSESHTSQTRSRRPIRPTRITLPNRFWTSRANPTPLQQKYAQTTRSPTTKRR
jgi:hypothetical protein